MKFQYESWFVKSLFVLTWGGLVRSQSERGGADTSKSTRSMSLGIVSADSSVSFRGSETAANMWYKVVFPGYEPLDVWGPLDMFYGVSHLTKPNPLPLSRPTLPLG